MSTLLHIIRARIQQFLFGWRLAYSCLYLQLCEYQTLRAAVTEPDTEPDTEPAGTFLLRQLRNERGIDA